MSESILSGGHERVGLCQMRLCGSVTVSLFSSNRDRYARLPSSPRDSNADIDYGRVSVSLRPDLCRSGLSQSPGLGPRLLVGEAVKPLATLSMLSPFLG